jgi:SAM-dependent methyltransferase
MTNEALFASPLPVSDISECRFYHALDLPHYGTQQGRWDLRGRFEAYTGRVSFAGKTVLDVGTSSGFLTFEAEKRGASVVSVDAASAAEFNNIPILGSSQADDYETSLTQDNEMLNRTKRAYWLAHREFNSKARAYYGSVYTLPDELGQFDIVIVGQILVHLTDGIRALISAARHCKDTLIIAEGMLQDDNPMGQFLARAENPKNNFSIWHYSVGFYRNLLACLGFALKTNTTEKYRCNVPGWESDIAITTLVFKRERGRK